MSVTTATGGYLFSKTPLIRTGFAAHTAALDKPVSELSLRALNTIQAVPWRINTFILDVISRAMADGLPIAGIETGEPPKLPPRMEPEVWEAMEAADKKEHTDRLRDIHAKRASIIGRRQALLDKIMVAEEMRDYESIWYPHALDFRGRIYPIPVSGPHPQSDDVGKALIMFSEGMPLGPDGEFWLCVRAANCFGMDKLPLEERVGWVIKHSPSMVKCAYDPFAEVPDPEGEYGVWWTNADEPWGFLATCHELAQMWELEGVGVENFVSHLPVPMDGSCNGLQHLSAMGLDPVGAKATNLRPGPRQDIYEEVAKHVIASVERDAARGIREALHWHGKVTRKVVKRAVMTTPYGVTNSGIRTQLIADGHVEATGDDRGPSADYMRDRLVEALGATIEAGKGIMAWLQATAHKLAEAGLPFDWTTPSGSRCRQAYHASTIKRIETLLGKLDLATENTATTLLPRKQALGSAPNVVHSFDAAHLTMTAAAAHDDGITAFAFIHDSFGTHAGNTTRLARILREQFVEIYQKDWLDAIYQELKASAPHVGIDPPPKRGQFDVREVLDAAFFFS